jgi:predicted RNA-binding protein YlxR (DUF448 family)
MLDREGREHGRGAYVCRDLDCISIAVSRGVLGRALETPVPAGLEHELAAAVAANSTEGAALGQE